MHFLPEVSIRVSRHVPRPRTQTDIPETVPEPPRSNVMKSSLTAEKCALAPLSTTHTVEDIQSVLGKSLLSNYKCKVTRHKY
jgi:hypothetical protein